MTSLLPPVLALILLSLVVWVWMYATRLPAMARARIDPESVKIARTLGPLLPDDVRQVADNYNHLMEQPTIFYALVFTIILSGQTDALNVNLAWAYVLLRVAHTLIQCTVNIVRLRFLVFALSTVVLMVMAGRELLVLL